MLLTSPPSPALDYPSSDGEPVAETYDHFYVLLVTLEVLRQYLLGRQATVLGNQFLYYAQGFPKLRVAPDTMVIFDVAPGGRDNYKIWEERQVPAVIFEFTSRSTKDQDTGAKKLLYEQLGVQEYWLFDPRGEWLPGQLQGYRLQGDSYEGITDSHSQPLQLRLVVEGQLIGFYRQDTGERLLMPAELAEALHQETQAREQEAQARERAEAQAQQAEAQAELAEALLAQYRERFGELSD